VKPGTVSVEYRFRASPGGAVCDGRATVSTVLEGGEAYIAGIVAHSGC
jgi:hypothetical protein